MDCERLKNSAGDLLRLLSSEEPESSAAVCRMLAVALAKSGDLEEAFAQLSLSRMHCKHPHSSLLSFVLGCEIAHKYKVQSKDEPSYPGTTPQELQTYFAELFNDPSSSSAAEMQTKLQLCVESATKFEQHSTILPGFALLVESMERSLSHRAELAAQALLGSATRASIQQSSPHTSDTNEEHTPMKIGRLIQIVLCIIEQQRSVAHEQGQQLIQLQAAGKSKQIHANDVHWWLCKLDQATSVIQQTAIEQKWSEKERQAAVFACIGDDETLMWHAQLGWNIALAELQQIHDRSHLNKTLELVRIVSQLIRFSASHIRESHGVLAFFLANGVKVAVTAGIGEQNCRGAGSQNSTPENQHAQKVVERLMDDDDSAEKLSYRELAARTHSKCQQLLTAARQEFALWQSSLAHSGAVSPTLEAAGSTSHKAWFNQILEGSERSIDAAELQAQLELLKAALVFSKPGQTVEGCSTLLNEMTDRGAPISTLIAMGDLLQNVAGGRFIGVAFTSYRRALQASLRGSDTSPEARGDIFVGMVQTCSTDIKTQQHWFEQALQLDETSFSAESLTMLAATAWNTGRARYQLGQYSQAKAFLMMGLKFARRGTDFSAEHIDALQTQVSGLEQLMQQAESAAGGSHTAMLGFESMAASSERLPALDLSSNPEARAALAELEQAGIIEKSQAEPDEVNSSRAAATQVAAAAAAQGDGTSPSMDQGTKGTNSRRASTPSILQAPLRPPTAFREIMAAELPRSQLPAAPEHELPCPYESGAQAEAANAQAATRGAKRQRSADRSAAEAADHELGPLGDAEAAVAPPASKRRADEHQTAPPERPATPNTADKNQTAAEALLSLAVAADPPPAEETDGTPPPSSNQPVVPGSQQADEGSAEEEPLPENSSLVPKAPAAAGAASAAATTQSKAS